MYLLDTNVISELRRGKPRQSAQVRTWAAGQQANKLYLSAVSILEMEIGVLRMERKDAAQGAMLRQWAGAVVAQFAARVLPFTHTTAVRCASLHVPDARAFRDSMIAATALEHGFAVVTRNIADFNSTGVLLVNPWDAGTPA